VSPHRLLPFLTLVGDILQHRGKQLIITGASLLLVSSDVLFIFDGVFSLFGSFFLLVAFWVTFPFTPVTISLVRVIFFPLSIALLVLIKLFQRLLNDKVVVLRLDGSRTRVLVQQTLSKEPILERIVNRSLRRHQQHILVEGLVGSTLHRRIQVLGILLLLYLALLLLLLVQLNQVLSLLLLLLFKEKVLLFIAFPIKLLSSVSHGALNPIVGAIDHIGSLVGTASVCARVLSFFQLHLRPMLIGSHVSTVDPMALEEVRP